MKLRRICIVTGSRAEYGLLKWVMEGVDKSTKLELQLIVTGMHLSSEFGLTYKEIENDGFTINKKVQMLLSSDKSSAISKSTGIGLISFADVYEELNPDIIIILGDRFEVFAASIAALFLKIPIAHIHGGEATAGAFDEAIRHSITKMSWWHFVASDEYKRRVIQLGENPNRVFNVGGLGVDGINKTKLLSKNDLMDKTGIKFHKKNLLITYHPVTLDKQTSADAFQNLLDALTSLKNTCLIFTMPNADSDSIIIKKMINKYVSLLNTNSIYFTSMGQVNYLSTLKIVDGVIGNSSSGLLEAPSFKIGTINIGDRQKGRLKSKSVIDCEPTSKSIKSAIKKLYSDDFQKKLVSVENPYGKGHASEKIIKILLGLKLPIEIKKEFYDL